MSPLRQTRTVGVVTGLLLVLLILGLTGAQAASATDYTWSGLGTGGWSDGNNWVGGLAPSGGAGTLTFPQLTSSACTAATPTENCYESNYSSPTVTARRPRRRRQRALFVRREATCLSVLEGSPRPPTRLTTAAWTRRTSMAWQLTAAQTWSIDGGTGGDGLEFQTIDGERGNPSDYPLTVDFTTEDADNPAYLEIFTAEVGAATFTGNGTVVLADPSGSGAGGEINTNGGSVVFENNATLLVPDNQLSGRSVDGHRRQPRCRRRLCPRRRAQRRGNPHAGQQ